MGHIAGLRGSLVMKLPGYLSELPCSMKVMMEVTSAGLKGRASTTAVGRFGNSGSNTGDHGDHSDDGFIWIDFFPIGCGRPTDICRYRSTKSPVYPSPHLSIQVNTH